MSFKARLTILISSLVVVVLVGGFLATQRLIETRFSDRIADELLRTGQIVDELMAARARELDRVAQTLQRDPLIVRALRDDYQLDRATWDNTLKDEVIAARFDDLDYVVLLGSDGQTLGIGSRDGDGSAFSPRFDSESFFLMALESQRVAGRISLPAEGDASSAIQLVGRPIFDVDLVLGAIFVGKRLDRAFAERVKFLSGVDLIFVDPDGQPLISTRTGWSDMETTSAQVTRALLSPASQVRRIQVQHERWLYLARVGEDGSEAGAFTPRYLMLKSLDREMVFVHAIGRASLVIGSIAILVAVLSGWIMSRGISRPVEVLERATSEIAASNFNYRVQLSGGDEFGRLGRAFNQMAQGLAERERIRGAMNKVVSKEIADELLKGDLHLGGALRQATVLFSDIRGFTSLAEGLAPDDLLDLLNAYFTRASGCVDAHGGIIDKYIGDAIMALFGVPVAREQAASDAVRAALDMVDALELFNSEVAARVHKSFEIGIGINTGSVIAGNVGSDHRLNYTVLGDEVNLASRLEGLTAVYGTPIIVSRSTVDAVQPRVAVFRRLDRVRVKGKMAGVDIFDLRPNATAPRVRFYERAWELLLAGAFQQSESAFAELCRQDPSDGPAALMRNRAALYHDRPAMFEREYVDGCFVFTSK